MIGAALALLAQQPPLAAQASQEVAPDADDPPATQRPSAFDVDRAYPAAGFHARRDGLVKMTCVIDAGGAFKTCKIVEESPKRFNFGWAALALAFKFRHDTRMRDGSSSEGHETPVTFHFIYDEYVHKRTEAYEAALAKAAKAKAGAPKP